MELDIIKNMTIELSGRDVSEIVTAYIIKQGYIVKGVYPVVNMRADQPGASDEPVFDGLSVKVIKP